ncbi:MAG: hypothetical protein K0R65_1660 [Crocinitomicaceae bacterium]|jgi:hypothetical protein|nr:hypothetical protein [Crocinitomicaceae bacterium]
MRHLLSGLCLAFAFYAFPQSKGIILMTGATFEELGLSFSDIRFEIDGQNWISNKLPMGKNVKITVFEPKGFFIENGYCQPGISILVKRLNGDTLGYSPNIFNPYEQMEASRLSQLVLNFGLKDRVSAGESCLLEAVFFDARGTNKIILDLHFTLTESQDQLQTASTYSFAESGCQAITTLPIDKIHSKDTLIGQENYREVLLEGVLLSKKEAESLSNSFTFYKTDFRKGTTLPVDPLKAISVLYHPESKLCNIRILVPKNLSTEAFYYWRLRLENEDKKQVIDLLNSL